MEYGAAIQSREAVMEGVPEMLAEVQVEGTSSGRNQVGHHPSPHPLGFPVKSLLKRKGHGDEALAVAFTACGSSGSRVIPTRTIRFVLFPSLRKFLLNLRLRR
jgi:hypothetical protein